MTFYDTLKKVCREKRTSPCAVVSELGMSKSNITKWKQGRSPRLDVVVKIAEHLDVNVERLTTSQESGRNTTEVFRTNASNIVYAIRCLHNGKVYIGRTQDIKKRMNCHLNELKAGKKDGNFQADFNRYGADGFEVYILESGISTCDVSGRETHWIREYDATNPRCGYNKFVKKEVSGFENVKYGPPPKAEVSQ